MVARASLIVAWLALGAVEAAAAPAQGRLLVNGAEPDCPRAAELASSVNRLLGRSALVDDGEELRVYWRTEPVEQGTVSVFQLVARDGSVIGTRAVRADGQDCGARRDADALALALMLDVPGQARPAPGPELALALGSTAVVGWLPAPRLGLDTSLALAGRRRLWPALGFAWWPASAYSAAPGHYQMSAWLLSLTGSLALWESPLRRAGLRAGVRAGSVSARGLALPVNASSSRAVADVTAAAEASVRLLGPVWLSAAAGAAVPLRRPEVVFLDGDGRTVNAHRAGGVSGLISVAAVVHFLP